MTWQLAYILILLALCVGLFVRGRPQMDAVALIAVAALPLSGVISMGEALSGFASPSVMLIAALFVMGDALVRSGIARGVGDAIAAKAGASEPLLIALLMTAAAGLSAVMSSTGVVAIFIPIALRIARASSMPAGRLMMPLSTAALIAGMLTLVATPPNMVVSAEMVRRGHEGFGFFEFTPVGLPILILGIGWMILMRRRLGGAGAAPPATRPHLSDWIEEWGLQGRARRLRVGPGSDLIGRSLGELGLHGSAGVTLFGVERPGRFTREAQPPEPSLRLREHDVLLLDVQGERFDAALYSADHGLTDLPPLAGPGFSHGEAAGLVAAVIPPESPLVGRSPVQARLRDSIGLSAIGIKRGGAPLPEAPANVTLRAGDVLLLGGPWPAILRLPQARRELAALDLPLEADDYAPARDKAPAVLAILAATVFAMAAGLLPNAQAALIGALALGLVGAMDMTAAYRSMHWRTLILIAGMMPFAMALERTGGADMAANGILSALGDAPPRAILGAIFVATSCLSLVISNTATAVLMAPVALSMAEAAGAPPHAYALMVALGASAAFSTPVASPVNMLVVEPGGYSFGDFVRIGLPFTLITLATSLIIVPLILPV